MALGLALEGEHARVDVGEVPEEKEKEEMNNEKAGKEKEKEETNRRLPRMVSTKPFFLQPSTQLWRNLPMAGNWARKEETSFFASSSPISSSSARALGPIPRNS